jgi:hypothetical protein
MPIFRYEARTEHSTQTGEVEAVNRIVAIRQIKALGLTPIKVTEVKAPDAQVLAVVKPRAAYLWDCPACKERNFFMPATQEAVLQRMTPEESAEMQERLGVEFPREEMTPEFESMINEVVQDFRFVRLPDEVTCHHCLVMFKTEK